MIFDQLQTIDAILRDPDTGLAAEVAAVAAAKGVIVPGPVEIETWRIKWPGEFAGYPSLQQFWREAPRLDPESQGSWEGDFGFQWVVWFQVADLEAQKHMAIYAHALRRIADRLPGNGTIKEVGAVQIAAVDTREVDSQYAAFAFSFQTTEMDVQP
ncbi:MAG TPA: hypothetical protein VF158_15870 [Longimicrobiales bacterium]